MKKIFLLLTLLMMPLMVMAYMYNAEVDGIYYWLDTDTKQAGVSNNGDYNYKGHVTIPRTIKSGEETYNVSYIGQNSFGGCTELTSVTIPNSVTYIGAWAFLNCSGLTSVTIPNSVTNMGGSVFNSCSNLKSVIIGNGVTSIESSTFVNCSSLTSVTIGSDECSR